VAFLFFFGGGGASVRISAGFPVSATEVFVVNPVSASE
jgi:hypothetical protein